LPFDKLKTQRVFGDKILNTRCGQNTIDIYLLMYYSIIAKMNGGRSRVAQEICMLILLKTFILTVFLNNLTQSELITRLSLANFTKLYLVAQWMQSIDCF